MEILNSNPVNNINKAEPINRAGNNSAVQTDNKPKEIPPSFPCEKVEVSTNQGSAKEVIEFCNSEEPVKREPVDLIPLKPIEGYVVVSHPGQDPLKLIMSNLKTDFYTNQKEEKYEVKLTHIKSKDGSSGDWKANKDFKGYEYFLDSQNENDWKERSTEHVFVAEVWSPPPDKVENIIFISAGQQGASMARMAYPAVVTGQPKNWDDAEDGKSWKQLKDKNVEITSKSVAGQIIYDYKNNGSKQYGFDPSNTYMALVFDAGFYWGMDEDKKDESLNNYTEWIMSKCNSNENKNLKNVYMAGASRGGDLVCRIAYEMRNDDELKDKLKDTEIIVSSFDGVANQKQGELFTTEETIDNPLGKGKAYIADFNKFVNSEALHILQIAGGQKVFPLSSARGFSMKEEKEGTFEFEWVDKKHTEIGQHWHEEVTEKQLHWLEQWVKR